VRPACCFFFLALGLAMAATLPLTTSDISLMLRSGYSVPTIEAELATRHFADQLDEGKRNQLIKAGATTELLDAIESGNFSVPKDELEKSRRKMDEQAAERTLMAERAKRNDTLYQNQLLKQRARVVAHGSADAIAGAAKGNLVRLQNGNLVSCYDEELAPKQIYGLYFSAHWCPPCRKFTPQLVAYYNQIAHDHPEFEIIFVSADKSAEDMATYMRESGMPWLAIEYGKLANVPALQKYAGRGIPDLVIVDASGKVLADSFVGGKYVGPGRVLDDLSAIFARGGGSPQVAANR
jgi:nucleoredoxin